ncbi:MAG: Stk1 family PASTA domain-containing Ser/Thr kinase [Ruminococcus sp.]|nr:Stk1 family PASTA domain-containing Ser/Thr kinase [Ruminococcus sp.]
MDKYSGKKLDGRYEIHELIGVGGMAYVYRCTDTIDDREVAVKILKDEFLNNDEFIRRFKNESKAIAMLSHPNIVKVYDVSFGDMIQYIVMEYIDGITLKEYIGQQGILDWREALHLTTQILRALQHAHNKGVVHRDIKPHNIMLLQDGTIKVTDFGIARLTDNQTKTMTEQAIGSVHYIAPEQAKGSKTDGKSDIYSVGVMLYEMITGKLPFDADSAVSVAIMQLQSTPEMPRKINPTIPVGLEQITMHAMQKNPEDRYQNALDMLGDLERFRLNPNVHFDYKYFVDESPTKHVKSIKRTPKKVEKPVEKPPVQPPRDDEAEDIEHKKQRSTAYYVLKSVIVTAVIVIAVVMTAALFRGCVSAQATDVEVPNYVGMNIVDAKAKNPNNFKFEMKSRYVKNKKIGQILSQDPEPGSKLVKSGSTIEVIINGKDTETAVPYCINTSKDEAVNIIKSKNLSPKVVEVYDKITPKGYVCDTYPPAGVKQTIGSTVYVVVAKDVYVKKIKVPKVTEKKLSEAQSALSKKNLQCKYTYDDTSMEPEGTVIQQSPLQYSKVESGTIVNIVVSSGKGSQSTVNITVDMPTNVNYDVNMTVFVDGVQNSNYSKKLNPSYNSSYAMSFTGSGTATVLVMLDGQTYRRYSIDYTSGKYETSSYNFVPTEPTTTKPKPTTSPPTEAPVEEDDAEEIAEDVGD